VLLEDDVFGDLHVVDVNHVRLDKASKFALAGLKQRDVM